MPETENSPNISEKWLKKFELLKMIGADKKSYFAATKSPEFKKLSFREKHKINFNWLAFFFGAFYYFSKKMWSKGNIILGSTFLLAGILSLIESAFSFTFPATIYWIIPASFCSSLANYDYFKFVTEDEKIWKCWPKIFTKTSSILYTTTCFVFFLYSIGELNSNVPACSSSEVKQLVMKISKDELARQVDASISQNIQITLTAIRTTSINDQTGAYQCAANLNLIGSTNEEPYPITYTVEITDDGQEFYVSVFGL